MAWCMVLAVTPAHDDGEPRLPLLARARLLIYPYVRRDRCWERIESDGDCGCGCLWGSAIVGQRAAGILWRDRYGMLPADHPVADPEDEPRLVTDIDFRDIGPMPAALIAPDGEAHHLGGSPDTWGYSRTDLAIMEDRLKEHPDCYAVPFACTLY